MPPLNIREMFEQSLRSHGDRIALRHKKNGEWQTVTYKALSERVQVVVNFLFAEKVKPGERVGIFMENNPQWVEAYLAIVSVGAIAVPVDAKLRSPELLHILQDAGPRILFSQEGRYPVVADALAGNDLPLEQLIVVDGKSLKESASLGKIRLLDYDEALAVDMLNEAAYEERWAACAPSEDDIASLIYTSGTTGRQKGAMLTHKNFMSNVDAAIKLLKVFPEDNFLLILPLHHSLPFMGNLLVPLTVGASISLVESLRTVSENIKEVSPTILLGVPLLFEKMYDRIMQKLRANKVAWLMLKTGLTGPIRKKIAAQLGGKLRLAGVGGAPCDPEVIVGFKRLGLTVIEGYGLTETAPALAFNPLSKVKPGTVGTALDNVEIKILEPNEEGVGEVAAKGPNVMKGYYNNEEATAAVFNEDGWFLTGDLGLIDEEGYLKITGRKKSLIVNREGKNIYPEEVEMAINAHPLVFESLVLGYQEPDDSVGERVGVIVVPDAEALAEAARKRGRTLSDTELNEQMRDAVKEQSEQLSTYKRPRRVQVRNEEFEKTSTQKIKRYLYELEVVDV